MKKQKVIIITGGSSGIGLETALFLVQKGHVVYSLSRGKPKYEQVQHIACDVTDPLAVSQAIDIIVKKEGRLDVVVNNAGLGVSGAIEYSTEDELQKIMDLNVYAVIRVCQIAIPYLRKTKGHIINISSVAGVLAIPFQAYYSMTKANVIVLTEALRMELRPFGIKVSAVLPGDTKTNFTANRYYPAVTENEVYKDRIIRSIKKMEQDEQKGVSPLKVSKAIYRVMRRNNPPVKVTVGFFYKLMVLLSRILPSRLVNWLLFQLYAK